MARLGLRRIPFHGLRHSAATLGLAVGVPTKTMSDRLGHASMSFTADQYQHSVAELETEAADRMAALVFGEQERDQNVTAAPRGQPNAPEPSTREGS